jgi:rhodanese-related sulfurtransferase
MMLRRAPVALLLLGAVALGTAFALASGCASGQPRKDRFPYRKLRPPLAYEMMRDSPDMLILDLRTPEQYNGPEGHVRRAQNVPLADLERRLPELSAFRDDTFIVYCGDEGCADTGVAYLRSQGFEGGVLLEGGIEAWIRSGFRTVLPPGKVGKPGRRAPSDSAGPLRPLRPGEKPTLPAPEIDVPQGPPPPL